MTTVNLELEALYDAHARAVGRILELERERDANDARACAHAEVVKLRLDGLVQTWRQRAHDEHLWPENECNTFRECASELEELVRELQEGT